MQEVQDGQYYAEKAEGGHSLVAITVSGTDTIEEHEFYNKEGKVIYRWKVKKNADKETIAFRIKVEDTPLPDATVAYEDFDSLT